MLITILLNNLYGQWEILNEGEEFMTVDFVNDQVGWLAGHNTLLKTVDGGETWFSIAIDEQIQIDLIDFISEKEIRLFPQESLRICR